MRFNSIFFILIVSIFLAASCNKDEKGSVEIVFTHTVDAAPVQFNELIYANAAGNQYQINEIKYFISKVIFVDEKEKSVTILQNNGIHYVDCSLAKTLHWICDEIPYGRYTSVSFVFGLDENDNKSNRFVNPPECNFSWPEHLGGGYHYMQINGKFLNEDGSIQNINVHTGIGQLYNDDNEIIKLTHNYFTVTLPVDVNINEDALLNILPLNMEIQRWFDTPNLFNFNDFGTHIMQNQHAQELLKENGRDVFDVVRR